MSPKKRARVEKLNSYIQQLREDSDHETADEYESQLNFHLNELQRLESKMLGEEDNISTPSKLSGKKSSRKSPSKRSKPSYRGGGQSSYIPVEYRHLREKQSAFASPSKQQSHAGAIDHEALPYGTFVT